MSTALVKRTDIPNAEDIKAFAQLLFDGGMTNKHCNRPIHIAIRIAAGREVGLGPVASVNFIAIINGRAVLWGDAALALVRASGYLEWIKESIEGTGDDRVAVCITKRVGMPEPRETRFSVDDAKRANLWGKDGPWTEYTERQLGWRARGWNLRDEFGDVLNGLGIAEEELDVPVRVVAVKPNEAPQPQPAGQPPKPTEGESVPSEELIGKIAQARPGWLRSLGIDQNDAAKVNEAWIAKLGQYREGATSARQLSAGVADQLFADISKLGHAQEVKEVFETPPSAAS